MTREEGAWAAGLFEGEGSISFTASGGQRLLMMALNMADEDVVRRFHQLVGCGAIYARPPQRAGWKPQWHWRASTFEAVQGLVAVLWPWLGLRRRRQARTVLQRYHDMAPKTGPADRLRRNREIRAVLQAGGMTQRAIARRFNLSNASITLIKQGVRQ